MLHRERDFEIRNFFPALVPRRKHQFTFPVHMDFSVCVTDLKYKAVPILLKRKSLKV